MKRREFIKQSLSASAVVVGAGYASLDMMKKGGALQETPLAERATSAAAKVSAQNPTNDEGLAASLSTPADVATSPFPQTPAHSRPALAYQQQRAEQYLTELPANEEAPMVEEIVLSDAQTDLSKPIEFAKPEESAKSVQEKVANFETNFTDDVILTEDDYKLLVASLERVNRVQDYVGFGNFNILSFDDALAYAKHSPRIGAFTSAELDFLEMMFSYDSSKLGFFGEKVIDRQTNTIAKSEVVKMPGTGHYVFRGHAEEFYNQIRSEVGESLILTSGVRNIVKQYQLFMAKTVQASGNLSRASRSLAPPGHSYHAIGDFDVGQVGGGLKNFTEAFAKTDEFKRLQDLGYVKIRYTANNDLGVRYEPWHIRVV